MLIRRYLTVNHRNIFILWIHKISFLAVPRWLVSATHFWIARHTFPQTLLSPTLRHKTELRMKARPSLSNTFRENGPNLNANKIGNFHCKDLELWNYAFPTWNFRKSHLKFSLHRHFNEKSSSPDPTGTSFPVVLKIRSDTALEIPRSAFLLVSCLDTIGGTEHLTEFCYQPSPSSRLWYGHIVSNLCTKVSSLKTPTLARLSSLSVVTPENDQWEQRSLISIEKPRREVILWPLILSNVSYEQTVPVILWKEHENAIAVVL